MKPHSTSKQPWQRGEYRPSRSRGAAASGSGKPLSADQKARLNILAAEAFDHLEDLGLIEVPGKSRSERLKNWRHSEQHKAVQISSLRECGNNHFRPLMAHFLTLAGKDAEAFGIHLRTGRVKDRSPKDDTHENRETFRKLIFDELVAHQRRCDALCPDYNAAIAEVVTSKGGVITPSYAVAIAKQQCRGRALDSLSAVELERILFTVRNRIAAKEGRGRTQNRNKSQRRKND